jgi:hypothetical protein
MKHSWETLPKPEGSHHYAHQRCRICGLERQHRRLFRIRGLTHGLHAYDDVWEYKPLEGEWRWVRQRQPVPKCKGYKEKS